jgi:hypothetical protein
MRVVVVFAAAALVPSFPPLPSRVVFPPRRRGSEHVWTRAACRGCSRAVERLARETWNLRIRLDVSAARESVGALSGTFRHPTDLCTAVQALILGVDLVVERVTTTRSGSRRTVIAFAAAAAAADHEHLALPSPPGCHLLAPRLCSGRQRGSEREEEETRAMRIASA